MKTIQCIDCEQQFSGDTPQQVQMAMLPHYKTDHADIMQTADKSAMQAWMAEFDRRWADVTEQ